MARRRRKPRVCPAHVGPSSAATAPELHDEVPLLIRLEREVEQELRPQLRARLEQRCDQLARAQPGSARRCDRCGHAMQHRGCRSTSFLTRFGSIRVRGATYRCKPCRVGHRPLLAQLGAEAGRVSGGLARLLALLGVVVPYELAARRAQLFFGVEVSVMTVWRCVQRLGASAEQYVEEQVGYFAGTCAPATGTGTESAPDSVVVGVDGCALGMQVRPHRRRRQAEQPLPPLPAVEEGQFREVKTGVLLLPAERVESSPGRRSVVRRLLCTCLGKADRIFERLWAKLNEQGWLGEKTVVVIVGDGAEWIWNRASLFPDRCEILDFWHAVERAWQFARMRYGDGSARALQWVKVISDDLRAGRVDEVLTRLRGLRPRDLQQREDLPSAVPDPLLRRESQPDAL